MNSSRSVKSSLRELTQSTKANPLAARFRSVFSNGCSAANQRLSQVAACALALGLLVGPTGSHAATLIWTNSSGNFSTASNWDPAQAPATSDVTVFTNDTDYTINFSSSSPVMDSNTFSNRAGVVTINAGGNTWTVTNNFYVGKADSTSTVYLASGTLSVAGTANSAALLRIGDASNSLANCVGTLFVTNGTVVVDGAIVGETNASVGKLVITGPSTFTFGASGSTLTIGVGSPGSQLIVTNGGKLFVDGTLAVGTTNVASHQYVIFSGPTSAGTLTSAGQFNINGDSCQLVISNGAKITASGSLLFANHSSFCTGVVVGAGSALIFDGSVQIGTGSRGGTNNFFMVSDGGFFRVGHSGTFAFGNNSLHLNDGIQFGGPGAMSTAVTYFCRTASNPTNHYRNYLTVTNAILASGLMLEQGPQEILTVLANGTWLFTNSFTLSTSDGPITQDCLQVRGPGSMLIINGGTLSNLRVGGDNGGGINIGGSTLSIGASMLITNGGKLLSSFGTIGGNGVFVTGIVAGVGSVWSNYMGEAGFTNGIFVGANSSGHSNFFGVFDGGRLYNNGTFVIGNNATDTVNTVQFGGLGASVFVDNTGSLNIGGAPATFGNTLIVTNATLTCAMINVGIGTTNVLGNSTNNSMEFRGGMISVGAMVVRPSNTVLFTAGTLSAGSMRFDTLANNSNAFVVGDGTSAAYYDMAAGGSGFHNFNNGGLVVTNGASLRGNGTLVGNVTVLGTFAPGFSVGTVVASNNLSFSSSAVLNYELGTSGGNPTGDSVIVKGDLILGGTINVANSGGFTNGTYTLFEHTNTVSGTLTVGTLPAGFSATVSTNTLPFVDLIVTSGGGDTYTTWANFYGLSGGSAAGTADPDGDGMNNTNEFLAGFNPVNSTAYLHVISVARTGSDVKVTYLGANGDSNGSPGPKTNVLEFTTGTANGSYSNNFVSTGHTNILSEGTGVGIVTNMVDVGGATGATRYYRVRVLVP